MLTLWSLPPALWEESWVSVLYPLYSVLSLNLLSLCSVMV